MTVIAIINYDVGNIKSIFNAFEKVGAEVILTRKESEILEADGIVLPGVGAFSHGMNKLNEYGLVNIIRIFSETGKPILGICLGMQMLFDKSSEFGETEGLGLISGEVVKINTVDLVSKKLPHVGWSELHTQNMNDWYGTILEGVSSTSNMYFVHSYVAKPNKKNEIMSFSIYSGYKFCSSVKKNNIYGCQFHPEKSASDGLSIISKFVEICMGENNG